MTIAITARLEIPPERLDDYLAAAGGAIRGTRAEPGCRLYAFARDVEIPNVIWISEEWVSEEALGEHLRAPHIAAFFSATADIQLLSMDVHKYEVSAVGTMVPPVVGA